MVTLICEHCQTPFEVWPFRVRAGRRFCSMKCRRAGEGNKSLFVLARNFWAKVQKSSDPDGCWIWTGKKATHGYGSMRRGRRVTGAHRVSWELAHGPVPAGMDVRHLVCDNPPCVRPDHLALGSHAENMGDMAAKKRGSWHTKPERMPRGQRHWKAKLTDDQARTIMAAHRAGTSQTVLAQQYGVSINAVWRIVHGVGWAHLNLSDVR